MSESAPTLDSILADWRRNAQRHYERNSRFLHSLKNRSDHRVDQEAKAVHAEAFSIIDCTRCGNCCRTSNPVFEEHEIERIARRLGKDPAAWTEAEFARCEDEDDWQPKNQPCPLLGEGNLCIVYEDRPASCAGFPYTDAPGFACRAYLHSSNTLGCPAVFYIVEKLRARTT